MFPPTFKCCTIPVPLQLTTIKIVLWRGNLSQNNQSVQCSLYQMNVPFFEINLKNKQVEVGTMKDEEKYCDSASHYCAPLHRTCVKLVLGIPLAASKDSARIRTNVKGIFTSIILWRKVIKSSDFSEKLD
ncbi:hypothetical protein H5410_047533 [Solanum commersonii]|uniref:Uncharacterized protein n=1 Tax=Solanum commersonii TaxID=4109 RepID=A0A9J5XFE9_SOLCO|nr:hypothetical protein H5410_047533 [Solanum commersonii]